MAELNYKRLSCRQCNQSFDHKLQAGRPPVVCASCKSSRIKAEMHTKCQFCNCDIKEPRPGKRFCSKSCLYKKRDGSLQSRAEYLQQCRKNAKHKFTCINCGKEAHRSLSATNKRRGYINKYCSASCRHSVVSKVSSEISFLRGLARKKPDESKARLASIRALIRTMRKIAAARQRASCPCVCCGRPVGWVYGRPRAYCSKDCLSKMPHVVEAKKISKARRHARIRGAGVCESISPSLVFISAGWKCQICGKATPQRLRGTTHKRAPELDHIVPLSKGGTHTWTNVQCLCRECNGWKSDRLVIGQASLFPLG